MSTSDSEAVQSVGLGCVFGLLIFAGMAAVGGMIGIRGEIGWGLWTLLAIILVIIFENGWYRRGSGEETTVEEDW